MRKISLLFVVAVLFTACDVRTVSKAAKAIDRASQVEAKEVDMERIQEAEAKLEARKSYTGTRTEVNPQTKVKTVIPFVNGVKEGEAIAYYPEGEVWKRTHYKAGSLDGKAQIFRQDGTIKHEANYVKGEYHGDYIDYFKSGNPQFETAYKMGRPLPGFVDRDYRGNEKENPDFVIQESEKMVNGQKVVNINVGMSERVVDPVYYILPSDISWAESTGDVLRAYKMNSVAGGNGELEFSLEPNQYLAIDGQLIVQYMYKNKLRVAQSKSVKLSYENL
ncbi:toxin-antitoxin system YwqK family antitoxin [Croceimicrobium sp.]|uniref:toxin-antitoxin system YwqK family antitoxin n=1 Tax=Croceimicrobium sp. TaxID=2828340 RepID=UPI003BA9B5E0